MILLITGKFWCYSDASLKKKHTIVDGRIVSRIHTLWPQRALAEDPENTVWLQMISAMHSVD